MHHESSRRTNRPISSKAALGGPSGRTSFLAILVSMGSATFLMAAGTPPQFTSGPAATFPQAIYGSFTITTSGTPTPTITETGKLPGGIKFKDNGNGTATLFGRPGNGNGLA